MPGFQYVARNSQGQVVEGFLDATTASEVASLLRDQGLIPTSIDRGGSAAAAAAGAASVGAKQARDKAVRRSGKGGRIRLDDVVVMSRQFATMIRAGLPLIEALDILADQSDRRMLKVVMKQVERNVETGMSLTEALEKHPTVFNTFYRSMVKVGEASGSLATILEQVAVYLEKVAAIQRKIRSALMYPAVVTVVATAITIFLLARIVPIFANIFADLEGDLPWPTLVTVTVSDFIREQFLLVIVMVVALAIALWLFTRARTGKRIIDQMKLKMPVFGPLFLKAGVARFTRTLGTLLSSGVNILTALDIVARIAGNIVIEDAVIQARASIQSGEAIATPLRQSAVFPPMVVRMIDVGERTGALEEMLEKIAEFYEEQVDAAVAGLTSMIEPILIVFLGVVVGFIVISMFMPMFKMIELIG